MLLVAGLCFLGYVLPHGECQNCDPSDVLCGPQSLLAVYRSLGIEANLEETCVLSGFDQRSGATLLGLKKAAQAKGLHAVGMKVAAREFTSLTVPAIAHLWGGHFVMVEGGETEALKVTDPPAKARLVPLKEFEEGYSGFALLIAKDEKGFPNPEPSGPDLRCNAYKWDFGFIEEGQQAGHTFTLENKANEELVISKAETSCTCTQAFLPKELRIPPGGKGEVVVGFDSSGREGGQSQIVYIHSNDPITPVVQLRIGGVIKPIRLPVSARSLTFGTVKKRDGATREFSIRDPGDNSLMVSEVASDSPLLKTTLTHEDKQGLIYHVKAELKPGPPIGEFKGKITVHSNHPVEPVVEIPVTAQVIGDLETFPNQFFLGLLKKGQSVSKTITISTTAKEHLRIQKIDSPFGYVTIKSQTEVKNKKYAVTATLKDNAPLGLIKGEVVIHTNNSDQPEIRLPLYALVEE